jgi:hypothetical protein
MPTDALPGEVGNTAAASIPFLLAQATPSGNLEPASYRAPEDAMCGLPALKPRGREVPREQRFQVAERARPGLVLCLARPRVVRLADGQVRR